MSWPSVRLGDVASLERKTVKPGEIEDGSLFIGLENIEKGGKLVDVQPVSAGDLRSSKFRVTPQHILFGKLRPYLAKIAAPEEDAICSTDILPILPSERLDRRFLLHHLRTPSMVALASDRATGANLPRLSPSALLDLPVPFPPLAEQRRIAAILDQVEELRAKRRAAIALLDELPQAIFLDMFGDPVSNPKGWPIVKLSDLGQLDRGVSKHRPRNAPELLGGIHPLIQTGDISNSDGYITSHTATYSDFGYQQSKKWPEGTLCITIAANIARTGILTYDACFPDSVVGFAPTSRETTEYVRIWLSFLQKTLEDSAPESAQKNINLKLLRNLPAPRPPSDLQRQFTQHMDLINHSKTSNESSLAELNHLFRSIQARSFNSDRQERTDNSISV